MVTFDALKTAIRAVAAKIPMIDTTLSQSGRAADAKIVGDVITSMKNPNWIESNSTKHSYVMNKTHWSEYTYENVLSEVTVSNTSGTEYGIQDGLPSELETYLANNADLSGENDAVFHVFWDGEVYEARAVNAIDAEYITLNNMSVGIGGGYQINKLAVDNGYPNAGALDGIGIDCPVGIAYTWVFNPADTATIPALHNKIVWNDTNSHTMSIKRVIGETIHELNDKYLNGNLVTDTEKTAIETIAPIANDIVDNVYDTGWVDATSLMSSSFTPYNTNSYPRYRRIGNIVSIVGIVKPTEAIAGATTRTAIFTLPEDCRPAYETVFVCQGSGNSVWECGIKTDGTVNFARYRNGTTTASNDFIEAPTSTWLPFHATFFVG